VNSTIGLDGTEPYISRTAEPFGSIAVSQQVGENRDISNLCAKRRLIGRGQPQTVSFFEASFDLRRRVQVEVVTERGDNA
jgi:hypothetical protein